MGAYGEEPFSRLRERNFLQEKKTDEQGGVEEEKRPTPLGARYFGEIGEKHGKWMADEINGNKTAPISKKNNNTLPSVRKGKGSTWGRGK